MRREERASAASVEVDRHRPVLRRAYEEGVREYGAFTLAGDAYTARAVALVCKRVLAAGIAAKDGQVAKALARISGADLYLAVACDAGDPQAWQVLEERYTPRLRGLLRRKGANAAEADELVRELPGSLAAPPGNGSAKTRIGTYDGCGSLFSWLAVIALRRMADRVRSASVRPTPSDLRADEIEARNAPDPAEAILDAEALVRLRVAIAEIWSTLTHQESLALLLKYRDGIRQREIARLLGVGPPRVSRVLKSAVEKLRSIPPPGGSWSALREAVERHMATFPTERDQLIRSQSADG